MTSTQIYTILKQQHTLHILPDTPRRWFYTIPDWLWKYRQWRAERLRIFRCQWPYHSLLQWSQKEGRAENSGRDHILPLYLRNMQTLQDRQKCPGFLYCFQTGRIDWRRFFRNLCYCEQWQRLPGREGLLGKKSREKNERISIFLHRRRHCNRQWK